MQRLNIPLSLSESVKLITKIEVMSRCRRSRCQLVKCNYRFVLSHVVFGAHRSVLIIPFGSADRKSCSF